MIGARPSGRIYRKLVVASALVAVTAGVGKGVTSALAGTELFAREGTVIVFCIGVIAVLIAVLVNRGDAVRGARQVYSALMVLGMAMMLATCFGFDIAFLSIGKEALWLVFSCFMAYLAFRFDLSPVRVFGVGQGVYFLASTGGWAVGSLIAPYYGEAVVRMGVGVGLAFLVVVVLVYVFPETDLKRVMAWSVDGTGPNERIARVPGAAREPEFAVQEGPVAPAGIARATDPRYGLSQRELEILDLFAAGPQRQLDCRQLHHLEEHGALAPARHLHEARRAHAPRTPRLPGRVERGVTARVLLRCGWRRWERLTHSPQRVHSPS